MSNKKIRQFATEFILYKRSMGYVYETASGYLFRYIDYSETIDMNIEAPQKDIINKYLESLEEAPASLYGTVCALREFSRYLLKIGIQNAYVIPAKTASQPVAAPPYFFTAKEIENLFEQIDLVQKHSSFKGRELVIPAVFRLLYCCGLRGKEARTLLCKNVHLQEMYMDINVMLAYLMRYMGHQNISETLYYFHFVPEFFPTFCEIAADTEAILPEVPDEE